MKIHESFNSLTTENQLRVQSFVTYLYLSEFALADFSSINETMLNFIEEQSDWQPIFSEQPPNLPENRGVYFIRVKPKPDPTSSEVLYIGAAHKRENGIKGRLGGLIRGLKKGGNVNDHCNSVKIANYI